MLPLAARSKTVYIDHAERMRQALVNENGDLVSQNRKYVMRITGDNEDFNKYYFTIMDFKKATELFADPLFDGDPVAVYKPGPHDPPVPPDEPYDSVRSVKFVVSDVPVKVVAERVQYYGKDGKLITESLKDYTRNTVRKEYVSLDSFLTQWSKAEKKNLILQELEGQGLLLDKYADSGIENIETMDVLRVQPLNQFETPLEIISMFGGKEKYLAALRGLETQIYMAEA
jgi:type I restriction enzyme R subunit